MEQKERLAELLCEYMQTDGCLSRCNYGTCLQVDNLVNHLLRNGVTVHLCEEADIYNKGGEDNA